jgi:hypothetical protein
MNPTQEGLWLLGGLLVGVLVVSGNAESWSVVGQSGPWYALAGRGLLVGTVLYLTCLPLRLHRRRRGQRP